MMIFCVQEYHVFLLLTVSSIPPYIIQLKAPIISLFCPGKTNKSAKLSWPDIAVKETKEKAKLRVEDLRRVKKLMRILAWKLKIARELKVFL